MTETPWQADPRWGEPGWPSVAVLVPRARARPEMMAHLGLRSKAPAPAHALALAGTAGRWDADQLLRRIASHDGLPDSTRSHPPALAALALLWCGRALTAQELEVGAELYRRLVQRDGIQSLRRSQQGPLAQALLLAGQRTALTELLPELDALPARTTHYVRTDLSNPYTGNGAVAAGIDPTTTAHQAWERLLAAEFEASGGSPVQVRPTANGRARHLFDHLTSPPGTGSTGQGGPLVTVVVPAFQPDEGLLTSVASLSAQTYPDLEIVLVDDCSGPDYDGVFEEAAGDDPRVRLVCLSRNGGSYLARLAGIESSRGELITNQDADDWSHPERIAAQVAVLQEHPEASASRSRAVRAKDDLTHQLLGYEAVRNNASSLMFRRSVLEHAGTFLPLRKAADSEYAERLATLVGPIADTGSTLAITRLRSGSVSRGDFTFQWRDPDRLAFRGTYRAWHRRLAAQDPTTVSLERNERPIPAPRAFTRGMRGPEGPSVLRQCFLGDMSADPTGPDAALHDLYEQLAVPALTTALPADEAIGLWHVESPQARAPRRPEMHPAWFDAVVGGARLRPVTRRESVLVQHLIVLEARCLLLLSAQSCEVSVGSVQVFVTPADVEPGPAGLPVDLRGASDVCRSLWGHQPQWLLPESSPDRETVRKALPGMPWHNTEGRALDVSANEGHSSSVASTSGTSSSASRSASTIA